jgi:hypothetical protein
MREDLFGGQAMKTAFWLAIVVATIAAATLRIAHGADKVEAPTLRTLRRGAMSAVKLPRRVEVKDSDNFTIVWNGIFSGGSRDGRPVPPPAVDFKTEMVLAVFMGEKRSGGYAVEIKDAVERKGSLVVTVLEKSPGPDSIVTEALTSPFHLVAVKRSTLPVQWRVVSAAK